MSPTVRSRQAAPVHRRERCLAIIESALTELDSSLSDVVRTRIFITDISQYPAVAKAHHSAFADIRPAATMVEVSALIHPDMVIEIEADAVIDAAD